MELNLIRNVWPSNESKESHTIMQTSQVSTVSADEAASRGEKCPSEVRQVIIKFDKENNFALFHIINVTNTCLDRKSGHLNDNKAK